MLRRRLSPVEIACAAALGLLLGGTAAYAVGETVVEHEYVRPGTTVVIPAATFTDTYTVPTVTETVTETQTVTETVTVPLPGDPPPDKRYPAPVLENPIQLNVTSANARTVAFSLDNTRDYQLNVTEVLRGGYLPIRGGRNVNLIGGEVELTGNGSDVFRDHTGVVVYSGASGRTVHIEGMWIHGSTLNDGVTWNAAGTTVELQNMRIGPTSVVNSAYHPDAVQSQGDIAAVHIDKVTILTALQGTFFGDHNSPTNTPIGPVSMSRVNMIGTPGKALFWKSVTWPTAPPVTIEDSYLHSATPWTPSIGYWVFPNVEGESTTVFDAWPWIDSKVDTSRKAVVSADGNFVSWVGTNITGGFTKGLPPGGDFVPETSVGMNYSG